MVPLESFAVSGHSCVGSVASRMTPVLPRHACELAPVLHAAERERTLLVGDLIGARACAEQQHGRKQIVVVAKGAGGVGALVCSRVVLRRGLCGGAGVADLLCPAPRDALHLAENVRHVRDAFGRKREEVLPVSGVPHFRPRVGDALVKEDVLVARELEENPVAGRGEAC